MPSPTTVDEYIARSERWTDELHALRALLVKTDLQETIKWGAPCYTLDGRNVVGIGAFKAYVGLWFHQGALLSDPDGVLINAGEGRTKAQRQWRFTDGREIKPRRITAYVREAIQLQREGREITPQPKGRIVVPPELADRLEADPVAQAAFQALTPGRRREYADHVAEAKRESTRRGRAEKALPLIRAGRGLNDRYRSG